MSDSAKPDPEALHITLLGMAMLCFAGSRPSRLERKAAGLLAYLAIEGETRRERLAGLLWPEVPESTARNNLAQTLKRLKQSAGWALVEGREHLRLAAQVRADAADLLRLKEEGCREALADLPGALLAGLDYDDCADFSDWLRERRAHFARLQLEALARLAKLAEENGDLHVAQGFALRLLGCDACSELAHRHVMRLYWLLGDRAAAMAAFEGCRATLLRELGVQPGAETLELMQAIARSGDGVRPVAVRARKLPATLLRPPRLAGRDALLAQMEAAWARGQAIFIDGEPGAGKTRLMQDFLGAKGRFYNFEGRPEDVGVPFATQSRSYRQMLRAFPGVRLPEWVRLELARILPDLGPSPGPLSQEHDKLRLFHAMAEATQRAVDAGMRLVALDDLQFVDLASLEAGHFVYAQHWGRSDGMRTVIGLRRKELAPEAERALAWVIDRGFGVMVTAPALDEAALAELLAGIDADITPLAPALHRHCGGNPYFVLETLKALYESGGLEHVLPERLPIPMRVQTLLGERLSRLAPEALQIARIAALTGDPFTPALAAGVLARPAHALAGSWTELEAAQILVGNGFVHTLCREAVLAGMPEPVRVALQERIDAFAS